MHSLLELTDGTDDLIVISPEEALVGIASDLETKNPRFRLSHIDDLGYPNAHAQWEIDNDGTRNDLELSGEIDALHIRFNDQEKFTLNKEGNVVIEGKLDVKNGFSNYGNATFKFSANQLVTIDSGSSYLPMLHLKSYSSTRIVDGEEVPEVDTAARKDVFIVKASGEAELSGHLSVMPGEKDNQAVTYNQMLELEQEIEALVPSVERGQFEITLDVIDGGDQYDGKFNMFREFTTDDKSAADSGLFPSL